ncbi:MAG: Rnase Y domain-containing protein, partial [Desulfobacteraceae bacterium]|nr:Rnase Y domain-containing protein [Desulfobacteraceae bacterium]
MHEYSILLSLIGFGAGFLIAYWVRGRIVSQKVKHAENEAVRILDDAARKSETLLKEAELGAKDQLFKMKNE